MADHRPWPKPRPPLSFHQRGRSRPSGIPADWTCLRYIHPRTDNSIDLDAEASWPRTCPKARPVSGRYVVARAPEGVLATIPSIPPKVRANAQCPEGQPRMRGRATVPPKGSCRFAPKRWIPPPVPEGPDLGIQRASVGCRRTPEGQRRFPADSGHSFPARSEDRSVPLRPGATPSRRSLTAAALPEGFTASPAIDSASPGPKALRASSAQCCGRSGFPVGFRRARPSFRCVLPLPPEGFGGRDRLYPPSPRLKWRLSTGRPGFPVGFQRARPSFRCVPPFRPSPEGVGLPGGIGRPRPEGLGAWGMRAPMSLFPGPEGPVIADVASRRIRTRPRTWTFPAGKRYPARRPKPLRSRIARRLCGPGPAPSVPVRARRPVRSRQAYMHGATFP